MKAGSSVRARAIYIERERERGEFARKGGDLRRDACVLSRVAYGRAECALFMARK